MKRIGILTAGGDTPALNATIHGAVVRANQRDGPWEAPLAVRHDPYQSFQGKSHQARAHELRERILELLPPEGPDGASGVA